MWNNNISYTTSFCSNKLIAAKRSGITNIIIPHENLGDVEEIESNILKDLEIIPVKNISEVLKVALA